MLTTSYMYSGVSFVDIYFCISLLTSSKLLMFNKNVSLPQCLIQVLKKIMFFIV